MKPTENYRPSENELDKLSRVILYGIDEDNAKLAVMGWIDDVPHHESSEAIVIYEPLQFINEVAFSPKSIVEFPFVAPQFGVPFSSEFFTYSKVEVYPGEDTLGQFYKEALVQARQLKPRYAAKWLTSAPKTPQQMNLPKQ